MAGCRAAPILLALLSLAASQGAWGADPFGFLPDLQYGDLGSKTVANVCFACSEFSGIVPNGGIGTFYSALAEALAGDGHNVTLLYSQGTYSHHPELGFDHWAKFYGDKGIKLVPLPAYRPPGQSYHAGTSYQLYAWLKEHQADFDVIHFPDWQGHAYFTLLAKHHGLDFQDTQVVVMTHGPLRWARISNEDRLSSLEDLEVDFLEQNTVALAPTLVSPSAYLLGWMHSQGWATGAWTGQVYVQPYIMPQAAKRSLQAAIDAAAASGGPGRELASPSEAEPGAARPVYRVRELVFFGRLEVRKGIVVFCDALDAMVAAGTVPEGTRVTFLGSDRNNVGDVNGGEYARRRAKAWEPKIKAEVVTGKDSVGALTYLLAGPRMAVMPSLSENSPLSILELIGASIPFTASTAGGIPELVDAADHADLLFPPELAPLRARLESALRDGWRVPRAAADLASIERRWVEWHAAVSGARQGARGGTLRAADLGDAAAAYGLAAPQVAAAAAGGGARWGPPLEVDEGVDGVSVVITTSEHGAPLRATLRSVMEQSVRPLEVVVVSTVPGGEPLEVAVGEEYAAAFKQRGWRWVASPGRSPAQARNLGLGESLGRLALLAEGSTYLEADALALLSAASDRGGGAVAVALCHFYAGELPGEGAGRASMPQSQFHLFLGGALTVGAFRNALGGPVVMLPRRVARAVGGYPGDAPAGYDHWELLARAAMAGAPVELVPRALYHARPMGGVRRTRREDPGVSSAIRPYLARLGKAEGALVASASQDAVAHVLGIVGPMGRAPLAAPP